MSRGTRPRAPLRSPLLPHLAQVHPRQLRASGADFLISSPLMVEDYQYLTPDYRGYMTRDLDTE